ncbi:MAG: ABC transporter ATP-binding protein [Opitutaceae bacterium]|nr:ABC transporter ATP-binding protein [Opitutaceae bacterium]
MAASDDIVSIRDLQFGWGTGAPWVLDVSQLELARGASLLIHGPSGCGKSTLLNLLAGVLVPSGGSLQVLGQELTNLGSAERDALRADQIGFIFQQFNLVPYLSVIDNVTLPARFSAQRRTRAEAGDMSLDGAADELLRELGMADARDRSVTELSVGQQQRVALARALLGAPAMIIADEPTSALDVDRRDEFVELLFRSVAATGSSIVMVSHDRELGARFDRVVDLREINQAGGDA